MPRSRRRHSILREIRVMLVQFALLIVFLVVMLTVVLPWAGRYMAETYRNSIMDNVGPSASAG